MEPEFSKIRTFPAATVSGFINIRTEKALVDDELKQSEMT